MCGPFLLRLRWADGSGALAHVDSLERASEEYRGWLELNNLGQNDVGEGSGTLTQGGAVVARVSPNGRVWSVPGEVLLYDPWAKS